MPNFKVEIHRPKSSGNVFDVKTLTMREAITKCWTRATRPACSVDPLLRSRRPD